VRSVLESLCLCETFSWVGRKGEEGLEGGMEIADRDVGRSAKN